MKALQAAVSGSSTTDPQLPGSACIQKAAEMLMKQFDKKYGGFGGRMKFPQPGKRRREGRREGGRGREGGREGGRENERRLAKRTFFENFFTIILCVCVIITVAPVCYY